MHNLTTSSRLLGSWAEALSRGPFAVVDIATDSAGSAAKNKFS